jgi:hypothetical protein
MAEQPELDLPPVPPSASTRPAAKARRGFGGFSRLQIALGVLLLAVAIWGMWVTRSLTAARQDRIVSARLSSLVGDYVEAQRYSGSPPERVRAEMQAFMASLDKELQRRSANGQVVLVGEAVLTKNVPDITDSLRAAVFASGVPLPKRASAEELQRMQQLAAAQAALAASPPAPLAGSSGIDPLIGAPALPPQAPAGLGQPSVPTPQVAPGASVSTFGGSDGNGGQ